MTLYMYVSVGQIWYVSVLYMCGSNTILYDSVLYVWVKHDTVWFCIICVGQTRYCMILYYMCVGRTLHYIYTYYMCVLQVWVTGQVCECTEGAQYVSMCSLQVCESRDKFVSVQKELSMCLCVVYRSVSHQTSLWVYRRSSVCVYVFFTGLWVARQVCECTEGAQYVSMCCLQVCESPDKFVSVQKELSMCLCVLYRSVSRQTSLWVYRRSSVCVYVFFTGLWVTGQVCECTEGAQYVSMCCLQVCESPDKFVSVQKELSMCLCVVDDLEANWDEETRIYSKLFITFHCPEAPMTPFILIKQEISYRTLQTVVGSIFFKLFSYYM